MLPQLLTTTDPKNYNAYLDAKVQAIYDNIKSYIPSLVEPLVYKSEPIHYRMRCEFAIYFENDKLHYVMYKPKTKPKEKIFVENFTPAHESIVNIMPDLACFIEKHERLRHKLFEIDFLCNLKGDVIISLIYHRALDEAQTMDDLNNLKHYLLNKGHSPNIVAHAKKQIILCDSDTLQESYTLDDTTVHLNQVEGTFTQPNAITCTKMLSFARSLCENLKDSDLLELYCGSGTFTVALAPFFRKVLSTEVARTPTLTALENLKLNNITNTKLVRLSALEVAQALNFERDFNRLKQQDIDLKDYNFKTLFIDPPRSGLQDKKALDFTARFDRVIYISCGPESFVKDLNYLSKTHIIKKLAFFDQFPYTSHLESGALLVKK